MSTALILAAEASAHLAQIPVLTDAAEGGGTGLLDWATDKNTEVATFGRALAVTIAIIFVLYHAIVSRLALGRILMAGLVAGLVVWFVFNITAVRDRVGDEVDATGAPPTISASAPTPPDLTGAAR